MEIFLLFQSQIFLNNCSFHDFPQYHLRYCGDGKLEDKGWVYIEDSQSDLVNVKLGGAQTTPYIWSNNGDLNTSVEGSIYRMKDSSNSSGSKYISTLIPTLSDILEYEISLNISNLDLEFIRIFGLSIEGYLFSGISPLLIKNDFLNIKISLGYDSSNSEIIIFFKDDVILDFSYFNWSSNFNSYKVKARRSVGQVDFYINDTLYFSSKTEKGESFDTRIFCYYLDQKLLKDGFDEYESETSIDIDRIEFTEKEENKNLSFEPSDFISFDDKRINFNIRVDKAKEFYDSYDGYDGYLQDDLDEFIFVSDRLKYIYDNFNEEKNDRISLYKDGKGFLNFEVIDDNNSYKVSSDIKNLKKGHLYNFSTSWRLNRNFGDEMRLFVDGKETANLIKFGSNYNLIIEDKFGDTQKERLQHFLVRDIKYFDSFTGSVSADSNIFNSKDYSFSKKDLGRILILKNSDYSKDLIGKAFVIINVMGGSAYLGDIDTLSPYIFNLSSENIEVQFPPIAGTSKNIITDFSRTKFSVHRKDSNMKEYEMGGVLYSTSNDEVFIESSDLEATIEYRANISNRTIEFVKKNESCHYVPSIKKEDPDIYIQNYGLMIENVNTSIELSSTTLKTSQYKYFKNKISSFKTILPDIIKNEDVFLQKIILDKIIPEFNILSNNPDNYSIFFERNIDNKLSSEFNIDSSKENSGRNISLYFDSDNVEFCIDGYVDAYMAKENYIVVYGKTKDGSNKEVFDIYGNGTIKGKKLFFNVTKIEGYLTITDANYEPCVISILERDNVFLSNGSGSSAKLFDFANGEFIVSDKESELYKPYELTMGKYNIKYPTKLKIKDMSLGHKLFIGTDYNKENSCLSTLDEFKVFSESLDDSRPKSSELPTKRNIYKEVISPTPACPDINTNALIPFDNPFSYQLNALKSKIFLDASKNEKYKLDNSQLSILSKYFNDEANFVSNLMIFGVSKDEAYRTYIEVHKANNGPIKNISKYYSKNDYKYPISASGPNDYFKGAGRFKDSYSISFLSESNIINKEKGCVEFWVSPELDTLNDKNNRYFFFQRTMFREK